MDPYTLILTPLDRLMMFNLLPRESDFITVKCTRELRERLGFTPAEIKAWDYREEKDASGNSAHKWEKFEKADDDTPEEFTKEGRDTRKPIAQDAEIYIGEILFHRIAKDLKEKDKNGTLSENEIDLYQKFVEDVKTGPTNGKAEHVSHARREAEKVSVIED